MGVAVATLALLSRRMHVQRRVGKSDCCARLGYGASTSATDGTGAASSTDEATSLTTAKVVASGSANPTGLGLVGGKPGTGSCVVG